MRAFEVLGIIEDTDLFQELRWMGREEQPFLSLHFVVINGKEWKFSTAESESFVPLPAICKHVLYL